MKKQKYNKNNISKKSERDLSKLDRKGCSKNTTKAIGSCYLSPEQMWNLEKTANNDDAAKQQKRN